MTSYCTRTLAAKQVKNCYESSWILSRAHDCSTKQRKLSLLLSTEPLHFKLVQCKRKRKTTFSVAIEKCGEFLTEESFFFKEN